VIRVGCQIPEQGSESTPLRRRHPARAFPEAIEAPASFCLATGEQASGEDHGVDRSSAGTAHSIEADVVLFKQAVEHAPGERAQRASSLERQRETASLRRLINRGGSKL
jgi:hypothetical protein